ncbi:Long-chain-fatty-acid--[acyl-carrier-protein] ligase AEE15, chloroplastic [Cymbomonas tetramitiformis]|uniref:Long-chain-fatty-acid--[acyl-carrier-protein] ligase AEE15, chloroplastic n=1 Tax=Cymbomonas tetramitiformis TaxID=36881 RepID=A0AAE0BKI5_9CHLO|nr:Long-chain-fatty-acid--[acyl-carrier-protein] ligase AEE15, chloroplastic [Cymbomonas tetramitiformis]
MRERGGVNLGGILQRNKPDALATLVYTSGTTGKPKGVMLTHSNLILAARGWLESGLSECVWHLQLRGLWGVHGDTYGMPDEEQANLSCCVQPDAGDKSVSVLPPWHIYERSCSYFILSRGVTQVYSSVAQLRNDLAAHKPEYMIAVPLVLDTLHRRVQAGLKQASAARQRIAGAFLACSAMYIRACRVVQGADLEYALQEPGFVPRLKALLLAALLRPVHQVADKIVYSKVRERVGVQKAVISGGGSLATHLDEFYEVIGLEVMNGWGLTETSPVLACRRLDSNIRGSIGEPVPGTKLLVVDPEAMTPVAPGTQGVVLAQGPGIMAGYYKNQASTAEVTVVQKVGEEASSWFNTGDLGWEVPDQEHHVMGGSIVLTGRAKDTIVLLNGENVEPQPIEDACTCSPYIHQMMLVGQDRRHLTALIVPADEALELLAEEQGTPLEAHQVEALIALELKKGVDSLRRKSAQHERIQNFVLLDEPFSLDNGQLTRTMKIRRNVVAEAHIAAIEGLYKRES